MSNNSLHVSPLGLRLVQLENCHNCGRHTHDLWHISLTIGLTHTPTIRCGTCLPESMRLFTGMLLMEDNTTDAHR